MNPLKSSWSVGISSLDQSQQGIQAFLRRQRMVELPVGALGVRVRAELGNLVLHPRQCSKVNAAGASLISIIWRNCTHHT